MICILILDSERTEISVEGERVIISVKLRVLPFHCSPTSESPREGTRELMGRGRTRSRPPFVMKAPSYRKLPGQSMKAREAL